VLFYIGAIHKYIAREAGLRHRQWNTLKWREDGNSNPDGAVKYSSNTSVPAIDSIAHQTQQVGSTLPHPYFAAERLDDGVWRVFLVLHVGHCSYGKLRSASILKYLTLMKYERRYD
jgi:hypothetical protein